MKRPRLKQADSVNWLKSLVIAACFLILLLGLLPLQSLAEGRDTRQTIRVGYYYDGDFLKKSAEGRYEGYDVEYLYEVAKYTDWNYEFVDFDGFDSALRALYAGEIDLIPNLFQTGERQQRLLFSRDDMGKLYITLVVPDSDTIHSYNDVQSFAGMRVGILTGSVDGEGFRTWEKEKGLRTNIVEMPSMEALLAALDSGQLDAVAITYMGPSSKYRIVAEFDPEYLYFGMPKDRTELMAQLNSAMDEIAVRNPEFKMFLYEKYLTINSSGQRPVFTREEKRFVEKSGPISVVLANENPPYSFRDENGKLKGAIPGLFQRISALSGLQFTFLGTDTQAEAVEALQEGKAQVIGKLEEDQPMMASQGIRLTDCYMRLFMNEVTRKGTVEVKTMAIPEEVKSVYEDVQRKARTSLQLKAVYYPTAQACIKALNEKKVDAVLCSSTFTSYLLNHSRASDYTVTTLNGYFYHLCVGVNMSEDNRLFSILNKCMQNTDDAKLNELVQKYSLEEDNSLLGIINHIPTYLILLYALLLMAAVMAMTWALAGLRKHMKEKKLLIAQQEKVKQDAEMVVQRTEFFGTASHDMRTPLNAILGFSDLALTSQDLAVVHGFLRKIQSSGKLMLDLINDTLMIAKTDRKVFSLQPAVISTDALTENVLTSICAEAEAKGVRLTVDLSRSYHGYLRGDKLYLEKIFMNLLANAVKFTPAGGEVVFRLEYLKHKPEGFSWKAVIRDNGVGISKEFLPKMFDLFTQENDNGTICATTGAGMGLAIVKRLVEAMHGRIDVQSEKGVGTEFTVYLPLEIVPDYVPPAAQKKNWDKLRGKRVLLCEDNALNAEIVREILEREQMHVICASNGQEGVHIFEVSGEGEFDAILMDIRMPVMNGYQGAETIRALPRVDGVSIPIIALSADAFDDDVARAKQAGMNAHVAKPVDPVLLCRTLCDWI